MVLICDIIRTMQNTAWSMYSSIAKKHLWGCWNNSQWKLRICTSSITRTNIYCSYISYITIIYIAVIIIRSAFLWWHGTVCAENKMKENFTSKNMWSWKMHHAQWLFLSRWQKREHLRLQNLEISESSARIGTEINLEIYTENLKIFWRSLGWPILRNVNLEILLSIGRAWAKLPEGAHGGNM